MRDERCIYSLVYLLLVNGVKGVTLLLQSRGEIEDILYTLGPIIVAEGLLLAQIILYCLIEISSFLVLWRNYFLTVALRGPALVSLLDTHAVGKVHYSKGGQKIENRPNYVSLNIPHLFGSESIIVRIFAIYI
jgi:hypothetical protein